MINTFYHELILTQFSLWDGSGLKTNDCYICIRLKHQINDKVTLFTWPTLVSCVWDINAWPY